jgi:2-succinyl-6-hydroxy-2,4-cyclohexadiene-1-carboxylate synthase
MATLKLADAELAYDDSGQGGAVTLLHGFTQSRRVWDELIGLLPARWRWIRPDVRGHGETTVDAGGPYTLEACSSDLVRLWDHLGVEKTHLVGYSMGGRLALQVATYAPDRLLSLVVMSAHAGLEPARRADRREEDEQLARRIESDGIEAFADEWSRLPLFAGLARRGPEFAAELNARRLSNRPVGLAASLRGMGAGSMEPLWDRLAVITCPALFIAGAEDPTYAGHSRRLAEAAPHGSVAIVADAGHSVFLEQPEDVARLLTDHLSSR